MSKQTIVEAIIASLFVIGSFVFWFLVGRLYQDPFLWTQFDLEWPARLINIAITLLWLTTMMGLFVVTKTNLAMSIIAYIIGGTIQFLFIPFSLLTFVCFTIFSFAFFSAQQTSKSYFENALKINIWNSFSRTIPSLFFAMVILVGVGQFAVSSSEINEFDFEIPQPFLEETTDVVLQLEQNNQEQQEQESDPGLLQNINQARQSITRTIIQDQINQQVNFLVNQFRDWIPLISAVAVLTILNIFSLPFTFTHNILLMIIVRILEAMRVIQRITVTKEIEQFQV